MAEAGKYGKELLVVLNFTPVVYEDYFLRVPTEGTYEEIFNSDDVRYGGSGVTNKGTSFESMRDPIFGTYSEGIRLRVPPLGVTILQMTARREVPIPPTPKRSAARAPRKPRATKAEKEGKTE